MPSKSLGHDSQVLSLGVNISQFHFTVCLMCYRLVFFLLIIIVLLILLEVIYCLGYFIFPSVIPKVLLLVVCFQNGSLKQVYKKFQPSSASFWEYAVLSLHSPHRCSLLCNTWPSNMSAFTPLYVYSSKTYSQDEFEWKLMDKSRFLL